MNKLKIMLCLEMLESRIRDCVAPHKQTWLTVVVEEIRKEMENEETAASDPAADRLRALDGR